MILILLSAQLHLPLYETHQRRCVTSKSDLWKGAFFTSVYHLTPQERQSSSHCQACSLWLSREHVSAAITECCLSARAHSPNSQQASVFRIEPNCREEGLCASPELNTELINRSVVAKPFDTEKCSKSYRLLLLNTSLLARELQSISLNVEGRG